MVTLPEDEMRALPPLVRGHRVVELGNKKNASGCYREWYESHGLSYVCIDWNGLDGALPLDFGRDLKHQLPNTSDIWDADIVTNFGFTEHVYTDQVQCWRNVAALSAKIGCYLSMVMPAPGHWDHHGVYQPHVEWYAEWTAGNGYDVEELYVNRERRRHTIVMRARRAEMFDYYHPAGKVHITDPKKRVNIKEKNCGI